MDATTPAPPPAGPPVRRWPRRLAIGLAIGATLLGAAYWYLGRESTLQALAQRVADASGGKLRLSGVSGSLYGAMHVKHLQFRTPDQVVTADDIDIDWSPWQLVSKGIDVNKLYAASLRVETLRQTSERTPMPATLAPPFALSIDDARVATAAFVSKGAATRIDNIRLRLHGDKRKWDLRDAAAATPWGLLAASGSIAATRPFKLDASASLTQSQASAGARAAQLKLRAGGDLDSTTLDATGQAGRATGDGHFVLSPYAPIPLRSLTINGRNIDPGFFNPALPTADLSFAIAARIDPNSSVAGSVDIANAGPAGTVDQQRLPLRAMRGRLGGSLASMTISDVLVDLGAAGKFTGSGSVQRAADAGLGTARFALHTDRLDIRQIHSRLKQTSIAGDLAVTNVDGTQAFEARLVDKGMRLDARATLAKDVLEIRAARLSAGASSVALTGSASLAGDKPFNVHANASHFNPASFGDLPQADINAGINASGVLAPAWKVAADFTVNPSRLLGQPLSGKGKLDADARHVKGVDASLALGRNAIALTGSFGAPGERLLWRVDGRQLDALRAGLYGALTANGALTGTFEAPRTTFELDARGLGWAGAQRSAANSLLHASGEARLAGEAGKRVVDAQGSGTAQRFNPAAFGSPLAGSINGRFDASGRFGGGWRGALNLTLQPSTLSNSPLWGYARLSADSKRVSNLDADLHVGPNVIAARGSFGAPADRLDWRIDAPQLAALGPDFGGVLRGSGTLSGTATAPSIAATVDGQNLKLPGKHSVRSLHASASLGSGRGANDPLVSDVEVLDLSSGATRIAALRLQTRGTRGAHTLALAARGESFDTAVEVSGGWTGNAWNGTVGALRNTGRYAFALQAPVPLRIATAPGAGVAGLARPEQIALKGAVIRLPSGSVTIDSLSKLGPRWTSRGSAAGVPINYLAGFSDAMRDNVSGDLTLGAAWALDLRTATATGGAPALDGMVHVFRERGDLTVGAEVPVVLGLRTFDARADVAGGALRVQLSLDGARAGRAHMEASAQLLQGRLDNASPLRLTANADMPSIAWLAPLAAQPGLDLDGTLKLALSGAGTIGAPTLDGNVTGDKLTVRWDEQGVRLRNGQLRAVLAGDQLQLQRLSFEGRQGTAVADGFVRFAGGEANVQLRLAANKLEALSRPDRTVAVSGEAKLVRDPKHFTLEGNFRVDHALVELAPQGRPTMSSDVVVLGKGVPTKPVKQEPTLPLAVDLSVDLGDDFRLRGMGIDATLAGMVRLRQVDERPPRLNGSIKVVNGTYAAYGQKLSIERGVITFNGPYDNPSLNILAVRKLPEGELPSETSVEAGVEIRGTALAPVAKLVSTPTVPDSEKLSWLVLGHGLEGATGREADVLAAAAGALLGGGGGGFTSKLAHALGVDELGLSQARGLENTVLTVGKRISSRAYLSFEQGAATATSVVRLRYKINPRVTLQFQTGTNSALDVLYSWAFD